MFKHKINRLQKRQQIFSNGRILGKKKEQTNGRRKEGREGGEIKKKKEKKKKGKGEKQQAMFKCAKIN